MLFIKEAVCRSSLKMLFFLLKGTNEKSRMSVIQRDAIEQNIKHYKMHNNDK